MRFHTHSWRVLLALWLLGAVLVAVGIGHINVPKMWRLTMRGQKTEGWVVSTEPNNHLTVNYTYKVSGRELASSTQGGAGAGNPPFENLGAGTPVNVYFDPIDPTVALLGEPRAHLDNEIISVGSAALLIPAFFVFRWRRWQQKDAARAHA
jgi:hypothetical protein